MLQLGPLASYVYTKCLDRHDSLCMCQVWKHPSRSSIFITLLYLLICLLICTTYDNNVYECVYVCDHIFEREQANTLLHYVLWVNSGLSVIFYLL